MNQILEQQLADQRDAAVKKVLELESRIRDLEQENAELKEDIEHLHEQAAGASL